MTTEQRILLLYDQPGISLTADEICQKLGRGYLLGRIFVFQAIARLALGNILILADGRYSKRVYQ